MEYKKNRTYQTASFAQWPGRESAGSWFKSCCGVCYPRRRPCGVAINTLVDLKHSFVDIGSLNIHLLILDEPENRKTEALKMDGNVDRPKQQQI